MNQSFVGLGLASGVGLASDPKQVTLSVLSIGDTEIILPFCKNNSKVTHAEYFVHLEGVVVQKQSYY